MTAVDTGWVTDEAEVKGFAVPLDCEDGAARILHPVFEGVNNKEKEPYFAVFLKDFHVHPW